MGSALALRRFFHALQAWSTVCRSGEEQVVDRLAVFAAQIPANRSSPLSCGPGGLAVWPHWAGIAGNTSTKKANAQLASRGGTRVQLVANECSPVCRSDRCSHRLRLGDNQLKGVNPVPAGPTGPGSWIRIYRLITAIWGQAAPQHRGSAAKALRRWARLARNGWKTEHAALVGAGLSGRGNGPTAVLMLPHLATGPAPQRSTGAANRDRKPGWSGCHFQLSRGRPCKSQPGSKVRC